MSQRGNDHSLLNETNESTFFLSLLFSMQTDCCISRGEKKVNVALHTSPTREKKRHFIIYQTFLHEVASHGPTVSKRALFVRS